MKIRIKNKIEDNKENFVYEVDDEKGKKVEINIAYLEAATKIMSSAEKKVTIAYSKSFNKFITNLQESTRYYDKLDKKLIEAPNWMHNRQTKKDIEEFKAKAVKYDKKARALFSMHSGWYENLISIVEEIKNAIEENYDYLNSDNEILYLATRLDGILAKYKNKSKQKTL